MKQTHLLMYVTILIFTLFSNNLLLGQTDSKKIQARITERYKSTILSEDIIGKSYMGREIARVMGYQGASWLERSERGEEERTDLLLKALALQPGMVVADIGAGTGYLSRRMALEVGPSGRIFAVDIQQEMITILQSISRDNNFKNIEAKLGSEKDVRLPASSVDLAIMVDVYHELSFPYEVLASIVHSLKPGGKIVFIEYKLEDINVPIKRMHKMSESQIKLETIPHQLIWEKTVTTLPWQHMVFFRTKK